MKTGFSMRLAAVALAMMAAGCATDTPKFDARPKAAPQEPPLPEIPEYPAIGEVAIPVEGIAVYSTLWYHELVREALVAAGYRVMAVQSADGAMVERPGVIVEPISFRHAQEVRGGERWLYTRIVVQTRRPLKADGAEGTAEADGKPRLFQAYARTNLGKTATASEDDYRENVRRAVENLMQVRAFRESL
jgi:hypothetical protein